MRGLVKAQAFALVLLHSHPAVAQTDFAPQFPALWQDYLSLCGPLIADPNQAFTSVSPLAEGRIATWATSADGASVHGSISTPDYARGSSMHIHKSAAGFDVFCEANIFTEAPFDVMLTANSIRGLLTANGVMTVTGGALGDVAGASSTLAETGQAPWVSLTVNGVFPTVPLTTSVDVQTGAVTVTVFGSVN